MSEAPTYALRTTLQVDEEQIIAALRAEVVKRLYGPDHAAGDLVVFTDAIRDHGDADDMCVSSLEQPPEPGTLAIVAEYDDGSRWAKPGYWVILFDRLGETTRLRVTADQIAARAQ